MRRIWKFSIPVADGVQSIAVPHGCKVLQVGAQSFSPDVIVWAAVSWPEDVVDQPEVTSVMVTIVPTGGDIPDGFDYLGTAMQLEGQLVWHLYAHRDREGLFT